MQRIDLGKGWVIEHHIHYSGLKRKSALTLNGFAVATHHFDMILKEEVFKLQYEFKEYGSNKYYTAFKMNCLKEKLKI